MALKKTERRCPTCGKGIMRRFARAGRTDVYKGLTLPLPADLALIECDSCGETMVNVEDARRIDDALTHEYVQHARKLVDRAVGKLQKHGVSLASVEREIGVSEGYLSKIRKTAEPSFQIVALLTLLAENPKAALSRIHALRGAIAEGG